MSRRCLQIALSYGANRGRKGHQLDFEDCLAGWATRQLRQDAHWALAESAPGGRRAERNLAKSAMIPAIGNSPVSFDWGEGAHTRDFRVLPRREPNLADWLADEAVCCELLSALKFPDHQGKYRELLRF